MTAAVRNGLSHLSIESKNGFSRFSTRSRFLIVETHLSHARRRVGPAKLLRFAGVREETRRPAPARCVARLCVRPLRSRTSSLGELRAGQSSSASHADCRGTEPPVVAQSA